MISHMFSLMRVWLGIRILLQRAPLSSSPSVPHNPHRLCLFSSLPRLAPSEAGLGAGCLLCISEMQIAVSLGNKQRSWGQQDALSRVILKAWGWILRGVQVLHCQALFLQGIVCYDQMTEKGRSGRTGYGKYSLNALARTSNTKQRSLLNR